MIKLRLEKKQTLTIAYENVALYIDNVRVHIGLCSGWVKRITKCNLELGVWYRVCVKRSWFSRTKLVPLFSTVGPTTYKLTYRDRFMMNISPAIVQAFVGIYDQLPTRPVRIKTRLKEITQ